MNTAIVLAGGLGTRLKSITHDKIPKSMVSVQGHPFLYWILRYLRQEGIKKIVLAISHHGEIISNHFGDSFHGIPLIYSVEATPLGTGGAIRQALQLCHASQNFIINGDTYFPVSLNKMKDFHLLHRYDMTLAVKHFKSFDRYGAIQISKNHEIKAFYEKKWVDSGYINGGIYLTNKKIFNAFQLGHAFSIEKEIFEKNNGHVILGGYKSRAKFIDIGIPADYEKIQAFKLR